MSELTPIAAVEFEKDPVPSTKIGTPGDLEWIPIEQLYIDHAYQRQIADVGRRNIRRVIEEFNWALFAPVIVARRGKAKFAVIDGQHRAAAAKTRGDIKKLPCLVIRADQAMEALAFAVINGNVTKVHQLLIFRARLAAGDSDAVRLAKICSAGGAAIAPYPKTDCRAGETLAVGTVKQCADRFGADILALALRTITATGDGNAGLLREGIILGTCVVLHQNPRWAANAKLLDVVGQIGVREIYSRALKAKADAMTGAMSVATYYATELKTLLKSAFGEGADPKKQPAAPPDRAKQQALLDSAARASRPATASGSKPQSPRVPSGHSERELIDQHLKTKGVRKFEMGATGNTTELLDWLNRNGHEASRRSTGRGGVSRKPYQVDGKVCSLDGLLQIVNAERKKHKLEPITLSKAA